MAGCMKMLRGVFVLGGIAASDVTTGETHSQMNPAVIHVHTCPADSGVRLHIADLVEMGTGGLGHHVGLSHNSLRYSCTN